MADRTILDLYRHEVDAPRAGHYTHYLPGEKRTLSTEEFFARTASLAAGLEQLAVMRGDRVILLSDNRPEWHQVDLAVLDLGAVDVPVYGTLTSEQLGYQVRDSGAVAAVVENPQQMEKLLRARESCPELRHLIQIEGEREPGVLSLDEVIASGKGGDAGARFWARAAKAEPGDLMTIIYTSGTTGDPKGVMLTHHNLVSNIEASIPRVPVTRDELALEFLPLCHSLERMVGYIYMSLATYKAYCSVYHVGELLTTIRPNLFAGVPRFYEKVYQKIMDAVASSPAYKRALFEWALSSGRAISRHRIAGTTPDVIDATSFKLADQLVLSKVRDNLGGRLRFCVSGGAELSQHVNEFFHSLGIIVVEGYGLTETSPVIAVNGIEPGALRIGTVGKPLANLEVKLRPDGELLVRGPSVMQGYWNKPEETAEVLDKEGFLATGDIAEIDDDGFILIVDRKKDLIVTAGGKNVAPQPIESQLKRSPFIDSAVLVGDRRPFITALISPNFLELERWAAGAGIQVSGPRDLVAHPEVRLLYEGIVSLTNGALARFEQVKKFAILPVTLTIESGHLTPTLKVKRRVVEQEFASLVDAMYAEGE